MSGLPSWARVGAKVVCIRAPGGGFTRPWADEPKVGAVYTIRRAEVGTGKDGSLLAALAFYELSSTDPYGLDWGYEAAAFRPVMRRSQEQDIATHFEHHLKNDHRAPERASA